MMSSNPSRRLNDASAPTEADDATLVSGAIDQTAQPLSHRPTVVASSGTTARTGYDPGTVFGAYQLQEKIGEGAMGAVFKATHLKLKKMVALKILPADKLAGPESVMRFEREMEAVGRVNHPNIVQAYDAGEFQGIHFIAMEYVEGNNLAQLVRNKGPLSATSACKAIRSAALGLAAAHKVGLVHRDIKPANLVADKHGKIRILDLGLALLGEEQSAQRTELTAVGACFGTPDYMAPEQWDDSHKVDARSDLYALGCTLHFLLVGRAPYESDGHRSMVGKMNAHLHAPIPDLKEARSSIPDGLARICSQLLAKDPADRIQTAAGLAAELEPYTKKLRVTGDLAVLSGTQLKSSSPPDRVEDAKHTDAIEEAVAIPQEAVSRTELIPRRVEADFAARCEPVADPVATKSARQGRRGRGSFSKLWLIAGGAAALLVVAGIIITITNRDGSKSQFEVADDAKIEIRQQSDGKKEPTVKVSPKTLPGWENWPVDAPSPAIAPFTAEQAKQHQDAWAKYLKIPVEHTNSIGMKFRLIPPGEFLMGSTPMEIAEAVQAPDQEFKWQDQLPSEGPQHKVILSKPMYLGIHEVTQDQYQQLTNTTPSNFSVNGALKADAVGIDTRPHPVESVHWHNAVDFCIKLNEREQLVPLYKRIEYTPTIRLGRGYRLPTEAEWEFACRAGTISKFWFGDQDVAMKQLTESAANNMGRFTHDVGTMPANPFGLHDMHGNVCEWVQDKWDPKYYETFQDQPARDPVGPVAGQLYVFRGGGFYHPPVYCRTAFRHAYPEHALVGYIGFRVAFAIDVQDGRVTATFPQIAVPPTQRPAP